MPSRKVRESYKVLVNWNKLHSVLGSMLEHKRVINNYICENDEDEAHLQADENDPLLFGVEEQSNVFMNDEVAANKVRLRFIFWNLLRRLGIIQIHL